MSPKQKKEDDKVKQYSMEIQRVIGNVALVPIKKGEQLSLNKITEPNMRTGLASQFAPGKRAMTLSVDETTSVGKLIQPDDQVIVIFKWIAAWRS